MLLVLKQYLQQQQQVSLQQLMLHFKQSPEVLRDMLEHWIRKGKIERVIPLGCGTRCTQCPSDIAEEYIWKA